MHRLALLLVAIAILAAPAAAVRRRGVFGDILSKALEPVKSSMQATAKDILSPLASSFTPASTRESPPSYSTSASPAEVATTSRADRRPKSDAAHPYCNACIVTVERVQRIAENDKDYAKRSNSLCIMVFPEDSAHPTVATPMGSQQGACQMTIEALQRQAHEVRTMLTVTGCILKDGRQQPDERICNRGQAADYLCKNVLKTLDATTFCLPDPPRSGSETLYIVPG